MSIGRANISAIMLIVAVALVSYAAIRPGDHPDFGITQPKCSKPVNFALGYEQEAGSITVSDKQIFFGGLGYVYAISCAPSILQFNLGGVQAGNEPPVLRIFLNNIDLTEEVVKSDKRVSVFIPRAGKISLLFLNPYYKADIRLAAFRNLKVSGCDDVSITLPPNNGGVWYPKEKLLTLIHSVPATIKPCGDGVLAFYAEGFAARGEYPKVRLVQNGTPIWSGAFLERRRVSMKVDDSIIFAFMLNPYTHVFGQRQIFLKNIVIRMAGGGL